MTAKDFVKQAILRYNEGSTAEAMLRIAFEDNYEESTAIIHQNGRMIFLSKIDTRAIDYQPGAGVFENEHYETMVKELLLGGLHSVVGFSNVMKGLTKNKPSTNKSN